jgi:transcriptional regulator with XRE-family HTH domain
MTNARHAAGMDGMRINGRSRAVQLGSDLRTLRKDAGLSAEEVANRIGKHQSTVTRWERGEFDPTEADVATLLGLFGVTHGEAWERLIDLARQNRHGSSHWVADGIGTHLAALIELERAATTITSVNANLVPGLLQTGDYARSIMLGAGLDQGKAEQGAIVRVGRQEVLTRHRPVNYVAYVGEYAIRYPACADTVMFGQLNHLIQMAQRPNVHLHIIPFSVRYSPAFGGSYLMFSFARDEPVVHADVLMSPVALASNRSVQNYRELTKVVKEGALDEDSSVSLISERARSLSQHELAQE